MTKFWLILAGERTEGPSWAYCINSLAKINFLSPLIDGYYSLDKVFTQINARRGDMCFFRKQFLVVFDHVFFTCSFFMDFDKAVA